MRKSLLIVLGSLAGFVATIDAADASPAAAPDPQRLAQNTGAADRSLGNGSMGIGEGIERLPERREAERESYGDPHAPNAYDEADHGDTHPDMEHRPRRTLGEWRDD